MRACDNPFRTDRVLSVRYRLPEGENWEALLSRLESMQYRAAIVGPEGSGKTTLQEDLAERLHAQGRTIRWLRLNRENRRDAPRLIAKLFEVAGHDNLLFVDGAEQIGPLRWRRFTWRAAAYGGLVINTHRPGWLPTLYECRTDVTLLTSLVAQLTFPLDATARRKLAKLFTLREGNIRLCLRDLYDDCARLPDPQSVASP